MKRSPFARSLKPLVRRVRLNPVGRKAQRERSALDAFRTILKARTNGLCELCGNPGQHAHHCSISEKAMGIHNPSHGIYLCWRCHDFVHHNVQLSYDNGWLIRDGGNQ